MARMADSGPMTLRLTEDEPTALRELAEQEGLSMQEAARHAVRQYVSPSRDRDRVSDAARWLPPRHEPGPRTRPWRVGNAGRFFQPKAVGVEGDGSIDHLLLSLYLSEPTSTCLALPSPVVSNANVF